MNRGNRVLGVVDISVGGINATIVDPRIVLGIALKAGACSIILAHNHPSGALEASEEDRRTTKRIKNGADILDIKLLDHLIATAESHTSFADENYLH